MNAVSRFALSWWSDESRNPLAMRRLGSSEIGRPLVVQQAFDSQEESDPILEDLEVSLGSLREELHVFAKKAGTMVGNITVVDSGDEIDCRRMGSGGDAIPSIVEPEKLAAVAQPRSLQPPIWTQPLVPTYDALGAACRADRTIALFPQSFRSGEAVTLAALPKMICLGPAVCLIRTKPSTLASVERGTQAAPGRCCLTWRRPSPAALAT